MCGRTPWESGPLRTLDRHQGAHGQLARVGLVIVNSLPHSPSLANQLRSSHLVLRSETWRRPTVSGDRPHNGRWFAIAVAAAGHSRRSDGHRCRMRSCACGYPGRFRIPHRRAHHPRRHSPHLPRHPESCRDPGPVCSIGDGTQLGVVHQTIRLADQLTKHVVALLEGEDDQDHATTGGLTHPPTAVADLFDSESNCLFRGTSITAKLKY